MSRQVTRVKFGFSREAGRKLEPKELLNFIEEPGFLEEFTAFGFTDDDLEVIQYAIMLAPEDGVIVPVSHSIRDLFYQNDHHKAVVRYVYFPPPAGIVLLLCAYEGEEVLPLTMEEAKVAEAYISSQQEFFHTSFTT